MGKKNEIVVYQPNETVRLEVRLHEESIWLPQQTAPITAVRLRRLAGTDWLW